MNLQEEFRISLYQLYYVKLNMKSWKHWEYPTNNDLFTMGQHYNERSHELKKRELSDESTVR